METATLYGREVKIGDIMKTINARTLMQGGEEKVTNITTKYDQNNGNPYQVIWFGYWLFDCRDGKAINSPTSYFIAKN